MIKTIVSIYDAKAETFNTPMYLPTEGVAHRMFADAVNDEKNGDLYKHPEDFELWHLGFWDDKTGQYCTEKVDKAIYPYKIIRGDQVKELK